MIHTNRIVTVGEQESIIDRPIVLYRGDREVEIEFTLVGNEFTFSEDGNVIKSVNASHGQLVLNTPSGEHMFSELAECHEGKVVFVVTKEMIDEFIEMGFYSFQIRLYDSAEMKSRVTIPPVLNGFDIRNPIAAEDETSVVDQGIVDYARIFKDQSNEELSTFDWTGAYNKTEWVHHDVITENKMNKIEDALYSINANIKESDVVMLNALDNVKKDADKYVKEHMAEVEADIEEFERNLNTDVQKFKIDTNAAMTAHKNEVSEVVNSRLHSIAINVKDFGAKGDGVADDTQAIQNAIDYANEGDKVFVPNGTFICKGIVINKVIQFECYGTLKVNHNIPCACVTVGDTSRSLDGFKGIFKLTKHGTTYSEDFIGLRVINSNSGVFEVSATNFTTQMEMIGHNAGCCYNAIHFNAMKNGRTGLRLTSVGTGWVNENKFYNGRFFWFAGNTGEDLVHIDITDASQNNNIFFSPSLEGANGTFIKCAGRYNTFYSPRLEGDSTIVNYASTSYSNQIIYPYFAENMDTDKIINEGTHNVFYGRLTTDMNRNAIINVGIEAFTNPNNNPDIDVPMRCGSTKSSNDVAFAVCNASKVDKLTITGNGAISTTGSITAGNATVGAVAASVNSPSTTGLSLTEKSTNSTTFLLKGQGSMLGKLYLHSNNSYLNNFISVVSMITTSGVAPSGTPTSIAGNEVVGSLVYNTMTNKLYIHVGGGVWKSIQFSD